ncbi:MAG TPA: hypothetical protein VL863_09455 [bacterium]|nr:hypothetical protein [bacterium]
MNLFSKFQSRDKKTEALTYDLPLGFRTQIIHLWRKGFGKDDCYSPGPQMAYEKIHQILCEEHQEPQLPQVSRHSLTYGDIIAEYFYYQEDTVKALDVVQVVFSIMEAMLHRTWNAWGHDMFASEHSVVDIIEELNHRFRENNIGYQYIQGRIEKIPLGPEPIPLKNDWLPASRLQI